ncbi:MAG: class I SAM-dependent methyltransferase [Ignavibacteria bacterium]|nr:class I SAM-dependent methyltransferase [Ignavibacteria bacterium]
MSQKNWYESWFSQKEYLEIYSHRDARDASKIVSLITSKIRLPENSKVLDVACGNGRHSILFARKGFIVTGIDISDFLIKEAEKLKYKERKTKNNLEFFKMDMRDINLPEKYDLAVNLFSSFGYFEKDSENSKVISGITRHLKKGGHFFFDFLNEYYIRKNLKTISIKKGEENIIIQVREINGLYVKKNILIIKNRDGGKGPPLMNKFYEQIRLYSLKELKKMFRVNGLKIISIFGDYAGKDFNLKKSERLILLAEKK